MKFTKLRKKYLVPALLALGAAIFLLRPTRAIAVSGTELRPQDALETVLATGRIVGEKSIPLAFPRGGRLARVVVENGDRVREGQVLMALESSRERNGLAQAKNALEVARLNLERASTIDLVDAREKLKQAEAAAAYAEANFKRQSELIAQNTITAFQFEQVKKDRDLAASALAAAANQLQSIERTQKPLAGLAVERAASDLKQAETALDESVLRAPFDGQIVEHLADKGEFVQAGQKVVTFIPEMPRTYAEIQAEEVSVGKFSLGQKALISSAAFPETAFPAVVERIGSIVDPQRGTFAVRLAMEKLEPRLLPESSVSVQIVVGAAKGVLLLEQRFIVREAGAAFVFAASGRRARRLPVKVVDLGNGYFGVSEGVSSGTIVLPPQGLEDGVRIRIVPPAG